jgi:hypothetical protein
MITTMFGLRCCCCAAAGKTATVRAAISAKKPGQIFLLAVMLEFLPFLHHCVAPRLTDGYYLSNFDLGGSAGILALGETRVVASPSAMRWKKASSAKNWVQEDGPNLLAS